MSARPPSETLALDFEIKRGVAQLFELAMRDGRTPPLAGLEMLARALGSVYRDISRAHLDPAGCPCGWQPEDGDLRALGEAMRSGARPEPRTLPNIGDMEPAGRA